MQVRQEARGAVFALCGELDFDSTVQVDEAGAAELTRGRGAGPVVVDCADLTFCDSSGISSLLRLFQGLEAQERTLRLAAVPDSVGRVFSLTGLDQVFSLHTDVAEALEAEALDADRGGRDMVTADNDGKTHPMDRQST
ncbi:STAS domain-containing protein [Streptomyces sp. NPDC002564]|uniref:STAS domain-containing protein n=1 Tax=Streptomyces sp. NPDC002564 TaxID=3364649 RepID=UPI0036C992B7